MTKTVLYERRGAVAWITLNRPEAVNAIDPAMRAALPERLAEADADPDVLAVVLSGAGAKGFCAGADVKAFGAETTPVELRRERRHDHWIGAFDRMAKPVIAAIHGYCLGGGLEMAMACDIRIAAEDARLGLPEVSRGTLPGAGGTQRLSRLVGLGQALDLILTAERIDATDAHRIGLVTRLCPPERLLEEAGAVAERIAGNAPVAVRYAKEAVKTGHDQTLREGMTLELDLATLLLTTDDRKEAGRAFREKRKPRFRGA